MSPCARMQGRRRGRHCLAASLMNRCWKCSHTWSSETSAGQRHDLAAVHTLLQLTPKLVVYRVEVRTFTAGHRAGAMKSESGVRVNSCTVSHWLRQPQCHFRTSDCSTVCNAALETEIFCHRYLENNIRDQVIFSNKIWWLLRIKNFAHNFVKMRSDLTFLSHIFLWFTFSPDTAV